MKRIGIGYFLAEARPEDLAAFDLPLEIARHGGRPVLLSGNVGEPVTDPLRRHRLRPLLEECRANQETLARNRGRRLPFPVLHALGDRLALPPSAADTPGTPDVGLVDLRHGDVPAETLRRLADWPLIATGTAWAARVLRDKGLNNVIACPPGIDTVLFNPAPRNGLFPERFVVFSGGALDVAGGLDILVAAFRVFRQRHPEALLACRWSVPTQPVQALSRHVDGVPESAGGVVQVRGWLARNGVPAEAVIDCGAASREQLPGILRECDLAVFPVRCEASGSSPALAALACGVPTVLAGNTGHLDLLGDHAYVLKEQGDVVAPTDDPGKAGWGECAVEAVLAAMERAYDRRAEAAEKGQAAARFAAERTHARQAEHLLAAVDRAAAGQPVPPPTPAEDYAWGLRLHQAGRLAEAETVYDSVLARDPAHVAARGDRGNARRDRGDIAGAEADFRKVLEAHPGHVRAWQSLGALLRIDKRLEKAATCLRRALDLRETPGAHWDLAYTLLLMGRYAEAWPHFEHRHAALGLRTAAPSKPRWDGSAVPGTLLVADEQGLGDTVQFLRFLPRIPVAPGGRVVFAGKPATLPLVRRILPAEDVFDWDRPLPSSDAWVPLMSLPQRLGVTRPEEVPPPQPGPAPLVHGAEVAQWRGLVRGPDDRPVVGLCWRGNPHFRGDATRSPGLAALRPLFDVEGVRIVSLQVGAGRREIGALGLDDRLTDVGGAIEAAGQSVLDSLAAIESCDLVISSCTSVAHMAGLAGRPCWVLLSHRPDWRWMTERRDTPWYPSLRLIRQSGWGDWSGVAEEAAAALEAWCDQGAPGETYPPAG